MSKPTSTTGRPAALRRRDFLHATALMGADDLLGGPSRGGASGGGGDPAAAAALDAAYQRARDELATARARLRARWQAGERTAAFQTECQHVAADGIMSLARFWIGTEWGLGAPQVERPGSGRVNCGTFVGRLLADAGFQLHVRKLQRQPSALIARTFATPDRIKRFSHFPFPRLIDSVREMGSGLFIIGLDYHVGLLVQRARDLRFVHASIVTGNVADEAADSAFLIQASGLVVVGKALGPHNLEQWLLALPVPVVGDY